MPRKRWRCRDERPETGEYGKVGYAEQVVASSDPRQSGRLWRLRFARARGSCRRRPIGRSRSRIRRFAQGNAVAGCRRTSPRQRRCAAPHPPHAAARCRAPAAAPLRCATAASPAPQRPRQAPPPNAAATQRPIQSPIRSVRPAPSAAAPPPGTAVRSAARNCRRISRPGACSSMPTSS